MSRDWYSQEEAQTIGVLQEFCMKHPREPFTIIYANGEKYKCRYVTSYEVDTNEDTASLIPVDYNAIAVEPLECITQGKHYREQDTLIELNYADFPCLIICENGDVIFDKNEK